MYSKMINCSEPNGGCSRFKVLAVVYLCIFTVLLSNLHEFGDLISSILCKYCGCIYFIVLLLSPPWSYMPPVTRRAWKGKLDLSVGLILLKFSQLNDL